MPYDDEPDPRIWTFQELIEESHRLRGEIEALDRRHPAVEEQTELQADEINPPTKDA